MNQSLFSGMILNLGIMVFFILFLGFFLTRIKKIKQSSLSQLKFIGSIPIGHKERLAIVEFHQQQILLGITSNQITTLFIKNDKGDNFNDALQEMIDLSKKGSN